MKRFARGANGSARVSCENLYFKLARSRANQELFYEKDSFDDGGGFGGECGGKREKRRGLFFRRVRRDAGGGGANRENHRKRHSGNQAESRLHESRLELAR